MSQKGAHVPGQICMQSQPTGVSQDTRCDSGAGNRLMLSCVEPACSGRLILMGDPGPLGLFFGNAPKAQGASPKCRGQTSFDPGSTCEAGNGVYLEKLPASIIHKADLPPQGSQAHVRIVRPQREAELSARGQHAVGLPQILQADYVRVVPRDRGVTAPTRLGETQWVVVTCQACRSLQRCGHCHISCSLPRDPAAGPVAAVKDRRRAAMSFGTLAKE